MIMLANAESVDDGPLRTIGIFVGIETYRYSTAPHQMTGVEFACADATAVAESFRQLYGILPGDMHIHLDSHANRTWFDNDLLYLLKTAPKASRICFYFAGHGFFKDGANHLAVWDTHPTNLEGTTVSLRTVLLEPIEQAGCQQTIIMLDACAEPLTAFSSRGVISSLNDAEFDSFVRAQAYRMIFTSCSPGQKSYPSRKFKHGIWTWFLLRALSGDEASALDSDGERLTDVSLRDFLTEEVVSHITHDTQINREQVPRAILETSRTTVLARFIRARVEAGFDRVGVSLDMSESFARNTDVGSIARLPGFSKKKGHFIPDRVSTAADSFVGGLLDDAVIEESKSVYADAKKALGLLRSQIRHSSSQGGANVDCDFFRMNWEFGQHNEEPEKYVVRRVVRLRKPLAEFPGDFDSLFPVEPDEFVIPLTMSDYDDTATTMELLAQKRKWTFDEDPDRHIFTLGLPGCTMVFDSEAGELIMTFAGTSGCLGLAKSVQTRFAQIADVASLAALEPPKRT